MNAHSILAGAITMAVVAITCSSDDPDDRSLRGASRGHGAHPRRLRGQMSGAEDQLHDEADTCTSAAKSVTRPAVLEGEESSLRMRDVSV